MSTASDSTASQNAHAENLEGFAHLHPRTLHEEELTRTEPIARRNAAWDGFDDAEARAWCLPMFMLPRGGLPVTVMAGAGSVWRIGGLPHLKRNAETARLARDLGHTPQSAWELLVALHTLSRFEQLSDELWYEPQIWSLWLVHRQAGADSLAAARSSVRATRGL